MPPIQMKHLLNLVRQTDLIVLPKFEPWLIGHSGQPLPPAIAALVYEQLIAVPRDRSASFSASSAGRCLRAQVYAYLGVPSDDTIDPRLANIFIDGTWRHLRIQSQLLHAGLIQYIEYPLFWTGQRDRGTMDGVGVVGDDHPKQLWRGKEFGLEIKGANSNVYRQLKQDGPEKYVRQYSRYFLSSGFELFVILVENKDTQEMFEWVVTADPDRMVEAREELRVLNRAVDTEALPPMLDECSRLTGQTFRNCPFGGRHGPCVRLSDYQEAKDETL